MNRKFKVCFVCTGNACRSPFAECVLRTLLQQEGVAGIEVLSRGTLHWVANPRDTTMVQVAQEMGYELGGTTTSATYEDLKEVDLVVVFESFHRNALTRVMDYCNWGRIILFDKLVYGNDCEVMDPNNQTPAFYRQIAVHIEEGCKILARQWKENPPQTTVE